MPPTKCREKIVSENIPLPNGFRAAGVHCGIKDDPARLDLALFISDSPCTAAGVYTTNRVCGAPVKVSRERVPRETARGVIINSGNANACTGDRGIDDARWMTSEVAKLLKCPPEDVLVCSTGVIGRFLPREKLAAGIPAVHQQLASTPQAFENAARGMMTTDTFFKQATRFVEHPTGNQDHEGVRVSGAAKGAAMIGPNMATMLAVIMTDAVLSPADADAMLRRAVDDTFNCISVEGHTSTSDSVILLASGAAECGPVSNESIEQAIREVAEELAQSIVRDAEGAEHIITIDVRGLRTRDEARLIARTIANGPLVKTAITGADPNWGRIISAAGYCGVDLREEDMTLHINGTLVYQNGAPSNFDAKQLSQSLRSNRETHLELDLPLGKFGVRFWTSDLTAEYVRLNSDYTT